MEEKWIDIALLGSDQWCHPIWTAINQALSEGRTTKPSREFNELSLSLMLRRSLLPRIRDKLNKGVRSLGVAVSKAGKSHISTPGKQANALMWDQESLLDLVLNIDCLLFELQSCVDLGDTLLKRAYQDTGNTATMKALEQRCAGKSKGTGRDRPKHCLTREILSKGGLDTTWMDRLKDLRNLFIHKVAPYPRVLVPSGDRRRLIFLKENVANLDDRSKDVELSELDGIVQNFDEAAGALQKHLIRFYQQCGKEEGGTASKNSRFASQQS